MRQQLEQEVSRSITAVKEAEKKYQQNIDGVPFSQAYAIKHPSEKTRHECAIANALAARPSLEASLKSARSYSIEAQKRLTEYVAAETKSASTLTEEAVASQATELKSVKELLALQQTQMAQMQRMMQMMLETKGNPSPANETSEEQPPSSSFFSS